MTHYARRKSKPSAASVLAFFAALLALAVLILLSGCAPQLTADCTLASDPAQQFHVLQVGDGITKVRPLDGRPDVWLPDSFLACESQKAATND